MSKHSIKGKDSSINTQETLYQSFHITNYSRFTLLASKIEDKYLRILQNIRRLKRQLNMSQHRLYFT